MTPLPKPDLEDHPHELWGQNVCANFFSSEKMRAYGKACAEEMRAACIEIVTLHGGSVEIEASIRAMGTT